MEEVKVSWVGEGEGKDPNFWVKIWDVTVEEAMCLAVEEHNREPFMNLLNCIFPNMFSSPPFLNSPAVTKLLLFYLCDVSSKRKNDNSLVFLAP